MEQTLDEMFPDHPVVTVELAKRFQEAGFVITAGTGREYYLICATKESPSRTVTVELDDEYNVNLLCFSTADPEVVEHRAYFPDLKGFFSYRVVDYVLSLLP